MLSEHPELVGVYNVGAGTEGVARAIADAGRSDDLIFIAHDLTPPTRRPSLRGGLDTGHEARSAVRVLLALTRGETWLPEAARPGCRSETWLPEQEKIRIDIVLRDNLP